MVVLVRSVCIRHQYSSSLEKLLSEGRLVMMSQGKSLTSVVVDEVQDNSDQSDSDVWLSDQDQGRDSGYR